MTRKARVDATDYADWLGAFQALLAGITAAQRTLPNPDHVVRWANTTANVALEVCREKRKQKGGA